MARPQDQWYPVIGLVLASNALAVLLFGAWVWRFSPIAPLLWFTH